MATPITHNNTYPEAIPSGEITWNGPAIPCLDICPGMNMNKMQFIIASKICELFEPIDLSSLTLQGALNILNRDEPSSRTIAVIFQLLLDNDVHLNNLIKTIESRLAGIAQKKLVLDLKCLATLDPFGNPLPYDEQSVLQMLVNSVCDLQIKNDRISGLIGVLQNELRALTGKVNDLQQTRKITTCIATDKTLEEQLSLHSDSYCNFLGVTGTAASLQANNAKLPTALLNRFATVPGITLNPTTVAQQFGNALIILSRQQADLDFFRDNCCKIGCNDIAVAFSINVDAAGTSVELVITTRGTNIPTGFVSDGSVLSISDEFGNIVEYPVVIERGVTLGPFDITGLDRSKGLLANISAKFTNGTLSCEKCLGKRFSGASSGCCVLTNAGTDRISIIYETTTAANVTYTNSHTLRAGESFTLPPNSRVLASTGAVTNTCATSVPIEELKCYQLDWVVSVQGNTGQDPNETVWVNHVNIGGVIYPIDKDGSTAASTERVADAFGNLPGIFYVESLDFIRSGSVRVCSLLFRTIPSIAAKIEVKIEGVTEDLRPTYFIKPYESTLCKPIID